MNNPSDTKDASVRSDHEFKNFHFNLCERFDYVHDEIHWKRDQVSLIEWIAKREAKMAKEIEVLRNALTFYADPLRYEGPNQFVLEDDKFTPPFSAYRLDVCRDGGSIAKKALASNANLEKKG